MAKGFRVSTRDNKIHNLCILCSTTHRLNSIYACPTSKNQNTNQIETIATSLINKRPEWYTLNATPLAYAFESIPTEQIQ